MILITHSQFKLHVLFILSIALCAITSCVKEKVEPINGIDGANGFNALVTIESEPIGENCVAGGLKISVGQDDNENGILDESEIESISYICNGTSGSDGQTLSDLLAKTSAELPGDNCEFGGTLIEVGNDANSNAILEADEVASSFFLCNGNDGANGIDGNNGTNGVNGISSIIRATSESSGDNCSSGGLKIEVGLDTNDNLELDTNEILSTYFICNGTDGTNGSNGFSTLSNVITEPAGDNCSEGGYKLEVGLDTNNNGTLDAGEVTSENYICNGGAGTNGNDGYSSLIRISTELPGNNCSNGGMKVEVGLDDVILNGILDAAEVDFTQYVCDGLNGGENGLSTIIQTSTEEPGDNCTSGGVRIQVGLDANSNNELDSGEEIGGPFYVCHGSDGVDGTNGSDGQDVIVISTPATSCANGGSTLQFGHDGNNDGDLSDIEDEILSSITICNGLNGTDGSNGTNGFNTIISTKAEDPGDNCSNGGIEFTVGLDINANNTIDAGEEVGTYYVCNGNNGSNGSDGNNSLISVTTFSGVQNGCTDGGLRIRTGIDTNGNGVLDLSEINATSYVCNGSDGNDGNSDGIFEFYFQEGFDGYQGVVDLSLSDKNGNETGAFISVDRLSTDRHGFLYFPKIETMQETVGTDQFEIVEALLYLKGVSKRIDGVSNDNWIGVKTLLPEAPLFKEDGITWFSADGSTNWSEPGISTNDTPGDANEYSDMFRLPNNIVFNGFIPLQLNRSEISAWLDPEMNKGLVLLMADDNTPYELDIVSSDDTKDKTLRPLLYLKVKVTDGKSRSLEVSDQSYKSNWNRMTYKEKLTPLHRK